MPPSSYFSKKCISFFKQRKIKPETLHENNSVPTGEKGAVNHSWVLSCIHLSLLMIHQCGEIFTGVQRHFATSLYLGLAGKIPIDVEAHDSRKFYTRF